jgi:hypothetical protein
MMNIAGWVLFSAAIGCILGSVAAGPRPVFRASPRMRTLAALILLTAAYGLFGGGWWLVVPFFAALSGLLGWTMWRQRQAAARLTRMLHESCPGDSQC